MCVAALSCRAGRNGAAWSYTCGSGGYAQDPFSWWKSPFPLHTGLEKDVAKSQPQQRAAALLGSPRVRGGLIVTFLAVMAKDLHPVLTCLTLRQAEGSLPNCPPWL